MTTTAARLDGDVRITGNLTVDGTMPEVTRANLAQDANAVYAVPLTSCRVHDALHTNLPGTSATDDLALASGTPGSVAPSLSTGDVGAATVTRYASFEFVLPAEYDAGQSITARLSAGMRTAIADNSATVDLQAYARDREGGQSADLVTTAAQSINALVFANKEFAITPTGLSAGDVLDVRITVAVTDAATATVEAVIAAIEMLLDVRG